MTRSVRALPGYRGTLAELYSSRANSFGVLRLVLASSVVVSHMFPIAWGHLDPLWKHSGLQTDIGKMAVVGFFVLSGFMITGSGARTTIGRFAWHRALRILPGLWGSLLVSALLIVPALYYYLHGTIHGYLHHPGGPVSYLEGTWNTSISNGWDISGVMAEGRNRGTNFDPGVNGALWSLKYEILCYVMVGLFAVGGVLMRARKLVPLLCGALLVLIVNDWLDAPGWRGIPGDMGSAVNVPFLGAMSNHFLIHLGFVFLIGATFNLYRERLPIHDGLAAVSALVLALTLHFGGVFVFGYPAFAYLLIWLALRLPRPFQKIGRKRDYSYGIYIYGFTVEQALAMLGYAKYGKPVYLLAAMAGTVVLAALSWHLVESPAMKMKNWTPRIVRRIKARSAAASPAAQAAAEQPQGAAEQKPSPTVSA
ncbi:acyltransferase [Kitasatospora paracochleata]|uniref:Peptidoglycan/LPS O-acetylase OafA/YrhL n=1 Tax=Kitasatospora paracochleata TaxID=58354 RepID=A0ABT1IZ31_9ACTN|nr:acyltransferase [Kitasatospora paracochleata]MCP2309791.1 peptidoglycan/LPS O-acetylase OafA/YrhL [Kitasatospora paracochleata]